MSSPKGYALITGAAKRIGKALALALANDGWDIIIHYNKSKEEALLLETEIRSLGRNCLTAQCDLSNRAHIETFWNKITENTAPVTVLINNASLFERDTDEPGNTRHNSINSLAPKILAEKMHSSLSDERLGSIINLLDGTPSPKAFSAYSESKKLLAKMTGELALQYAPKIRVNGIAPGPILRSPRQSEEHFLALVASTPMQIKIPVHAITSTALFLLNTPAITGQIVNVDGGEHLLAN